jgi:hypothetical protein
VFDNSDAVSPLTSRRVLKKIEVAFTSASQTEFEFVRMLIEEDRIPDDVMEVRVADSPSGFGAGVDPSIVTASLKAVVCGVNRHLLERRRAMQAVAAWAPASSENAENRCALPPQGTP